MSDFESSEESEASEFSDTDRDLEELMEERVRQSKLQNIKTLKRTKPKTLKDVFG